MITRGVITSTFQTEVQLVFKHGRFLEFGSAQNVVLFYVFHRIADNYTLTF